MKKTNTQIKQPVKLTRIVLNYEDGTELEVHRDMEKVGKLFFAAIKGQNITWNVVENKSWKNKLKELFQI